MKGLPVLDLICPECGSSDILATLDAVLGVTSGVMINGKGELVQLLQPAKAPAPCWNAHELAVCCKCTLEADLHTFYPETEA